MAKWDARRHALPNSSIRRFNIKRQDRFFQKHLNRAINALIVRHAWLQCRLVNLSFILLWPKDISERMGLSTDSV
jgi:hypothetical protein